MSTHGELYGDLKAFRFPQHLTKMVEGKALAPIHVRIKPINACNHNCWFCAFRSDGVSLGDSMDLKDQIPRSKMLELVDDLLELGVKAVTFSGGGEPLLYKPLPEVIAKLGKGGVRVAALTNGAFLRDAVAEAFLEWGTWVRVSMDYWDAESCAASRGVKPREYGRIIENLRSFAARVSPCVLGVSFVITRENASHILDTCRVLRDVGVNHVKLSPCIVSNDGAENNEYHAPIFDEVINQIALAQTELHSLEFRIVNHYHQLHQTFIKDYDSCPYLQLLTVIGADCNLYTCQDKAYTESGLLGSVRERRFKDVWFEPAFQEGLRKLNPQTACLHHCVANEKNRVVKRFLNLDAEHAVFV